MTVRRPGGHRLTRALIDDVARTCGTWLVGVPSRPVHIHRMDTLRRVHVGVYLAGNADRQLHYIGSVARSSSNLAARLLDHPPSRRREWRWIWPIVLSPSTPVGVVRAIEGHAIDMYGPAGNRRRNAWGPLPTR